MPISEIREQSVRQLIELGIAFLLSAAIGLEREIRHKSAALGNCIVVGTKSGAFLIISKCGFTDVLMNSFVVPNPSRLAAQIICGIGFIGAGMIFAGQDRIRGLTIAATVLLVTAVGMACGAGLRWLWLALTGAYSYRGLGFSFYPARHS